VNERRKPPIRGLYVRGRHVAIRSYSTTPGRRDGIPMPAV
jgi:hypothetical protein